MAALDCVLPLILSGKDVQVTLELLQQQLFTLISSQRLQDKSDTSSSQTDNELELALAPEPVT